MNFIGRAAKSVKIDIARLILIAGGAAAIMWAVAVFPVFWSEKAVTDVAAAITRGEAFDPKVLAAVEAPTEGKSASIRAAMLSKVAMIRLRQMENANNGSDRALIEQRLTSVTRIVRETLSNAPDDPFSWLAWSWIDTYRNGVRPESLRYLRMSYELGPYEGWIAVKRDGIALGLFGSLPQDLRQRATSEFVGLVRWGLDADAAEIAAGPARPIRATLFPELKQLNYEQRRAFANAVYARQLDDVPVPGVPPPAPPVSMPVVPPNL